MKINNHNRQAFIKKWIVKLSGTPHAYIFLTPLADMLLIHSHPFFNMCLCSFCKPLQIDCNMLILI